MFSRSFLVNLPLMAKSWLVDGRTLAKQIKACGLPSAHQVKDDNGTIWECPQCSCTIHELDESSEWPGLPKGVKFDPTDIELLDHLASKCGVINEKPHEYIDVFIPTIEVEQGICYQHPENLPGSRKDGNSFHLFYKTTNAYAKGKRKRRMICNRSSLKDNVRWHKTGETKTIIKNGVAIGSKKILVLYGSSVGGSKPCKMNWVMHQFHLGVNEDEKAGEYVVSKIFYQTQKQTHDQNITIVRDVDKASDPRTPMINPSDPPRPGKTPLYEDVTPDYVVQSLAQDNVNLPAAVNLDAFYYSLSDQYDTNADDSLSCSSFYHNDGARVARDLNLETTHYVNLAELYFPCEDSFSGSLDWLIK